MSGLNRHFLLIGCTLGFGAVGFYVEEKVEAYYKEERYRHFEKVFEKKIKNEVEKNQNPSAKRSNVGGYEVRFDVSAIKGLRPGMEDRWNVAVHERGHAAVLSVYDGHGGPQVSSFLMDNLSGFVLDDPELESDPTGTLRRACASCDEAVVKEHPGSNRLMGNPGPGSTAIVVLLLPPRMFVANVGDSRAIATDRDGEIIFQSVDQRPSRPEERSRIVRLGGTVRNVDGVHRAAGILAVSRAFGNAGIKHCVKADPEVTELDMARVETCILCSDGLTDVIDSYKAVETVRGASAALSSKGNSTNSSLLSPTGRAMKAAKDRRRSTASGDGSGSGAAAAVAGGGGGGGGGGGVAAGEGRTRRGSSIGGGSAAVWGTRRRAANALTSLAKMRQSMDNITALAWCCRALEGVSLDDDDNDDDDDEKKKIVPRRRGGGSDAAAAAAAVASDAAAAGGAGSLLTSSSSAKQNTTPGAARRQRRASETVSVGITPSPAAARGNGSSRPPLNGRRSVGAAIPPPRGVPSSAVPPTPPAAAVAATLAEAAQPRHSEPVGAGGVFSFGNTAAAARPSMAAAAAAAAAAAPSPSSSSRHERLSSSLGYGSLGYGSTKRSGRHSTGATTTNGFASVNAANAAKLSPLTKTINLSGGGTGGYGPPGVGVGGDNNGGKAAAVSPPPTVTSPSSTHKAKRTKGI